MTKRVSTAVILGVVLVGLAQVAGLAQGAGANTPVTGAWRVAEVTRTGPNAGTNKSPQPGLVIFTARHYSIDMVTSDSARPELPAQGQTDKQVAEAFGPFTANAGTYAAKGNELTLSIMAAKNPATMRSGSFQVFTFRMEGKDTLWLTQKATSNGPAANPTTLKLTRVE